MNDLTTAGILVDTTRDFAASVPSCGVRYTVRRKAVNSLVGRASSMPIFQETQGSLAELQSWVRARLTPDGGFVYRGQKANYSLSSTLERACREPDGALSTAARSLEDRCVREFRRRVHHYVPDVPRPSHRFELLALMQHHGAPTRLLDWTYSLEIATHFALVQAADEPRTDVAVWVVNDTWCKAAAIDVLRPTRTDRDLRMLDIPIDYRHEPHLAKILLGEPVVPSVFPVNPFRLNQRLTIQKGVFLCPGDVTRSFEENLRALDGHHREENVLKFILPHGCRQDAAERLYELNISESTLFPGLDGFARSLKTTLRFLERRRTLQAN